MKKTKARIEYEEKRGTDFCPEIDLNFVEIDGVEYELEKFDLDGCDFCAESDEDIALARKIIREKITREE